MLTESPIDAMSLAVIDTGYRDRDGVWIRGLNRCFMSGMVLKAGP